MPQTSIQETNKRALEEVRALLAPRAKSLIVTLWGDVILPFGGRIWLGSLVRLMEPLDIDERLVRTSVQRLVADGWLTSKSAGRRRDLEMPESRLVELRAVQRRMYRTQPAEWDGLWRIVVVAPGNAARRESIRRELNWLGFTSISPNLYVHPRCSWELLESRLSEKELAGELQFRFEARGVPGAHTPVDLWPLESIRSEWDRFGSVLSVSTKGVCAEQAFALRVLLVHIFRRIVLHDPGLPHVLLPDEWPEKNVRIQFRDTYKQLLGPANKYAKAVIECSDGSRQGNDGSDQERFSKV